VRIGDLHAGVPELRPDSRYNLDSQDITERFSIGVDLINVIVEVGENGCINHEVMDVIDRSPGTCRTCRACRPWWRCRRWPRSSPPAGTRATRAWRVLSRNEQVLVQALARVETAPGC
jgi:uncharacterized protein